MLVIASTKSTAIKLVRATISGLERVRTYIYNDNLIWLLADQVSGSQRNLYSIKFDQTTGADLSFKKFAVVQSTYTDHEFEMAELNKNYLFRVTSGTCTDSTGTSSFVKGMLLTVIWSPNKDTNINDVRH